MKVWVLRLSSSDDTHLYAFNSHASLLKWLLRYVTRKWEEEGYLDSGGPLPGDREEAIEAYFDSTLGDEQYTYEEAEVLSL